MRSFGLDLDEMHDLHDLHDLRFSRWTQESGEFTWFEVP
jgi:hypothetical protein